MGRCHAFSKAAQRKSLLMGTFDSLVIVGDSFCADRNEPGDWPMILANMLDLKLQGHGFPGRSWWSTRNWLKANAHLIDKNSVLIVCHTESSRLPAINDIGINAGLLRVSVDDVNNHLKSVDPNGRLHKLVNDFYTSELYVDDFYHWANNAWMQELDAMSANIGKTIHVPSFGHQEFDALHNLKNSIVAIPSSDKSLRRLSMKEIGDKHYFGYDSRRNHLNAHNNHQLANALYSIINSNISVGVAEFNNLDQWDFTPVKFEIR